MRRRHRAGPVATFDDPEGYGTVTADDRRGTWFFHCTAIADGTRPIEVGAEVAFEVVPGRLGRFEATDLRPRLTAAGTYGPGIAPAVARRLPDAVAAVETRALTKRYGARTGHRGHRSGGAGGGGLRLPRPQRRRQDDDDPGAARRAAARPRARRRCSGLDSHDDAIAVHGRIGYLPGRPGALRAAHRRRPPRLAAPGCGAIRTRSTATSSSSGSRSSSTGRSSDLSKGNRQKIGLVQAFMHRPELVILDEPTTGLDPLMQDEFQQLLARAHRRTAAPCSCRRTRSTRCSTWPTGSASSARVGWSRCRPSRTSRRPPSTGCEIRFAEIVAPDEFARAAGRARPGGRPDPTAPAAACAFALAGDPDPVVKAAAAHTVTDLVSQHADLEEIFLTFYRGDGRRGTRRRSARRIRERS